MEDNKTFYIEKDGQKIKATILTNLEIYGDNYCVYTIPVTDSKKSNLYCAKLVNNQLIKIEDEEELKLTGKIINQLMNGN